MKRRSMRLTAIAMAISMMFTPTAFAAIDDDALRAHVQEKNGGVLALDEVPVPEPPNLSQFVVNKSVAIMLGKALYWDMQTGGDGQTACASCHFHAGADNRTKNQVSPGLLAGDTIFGVAGFSDVTGPNYTLTEADFPFPKELNDVVSSQGVFLRSFAPSVFDPADACTSEADDIFNILNANTRRVAPVNSPTTINAIFNHRNFWDGRANDSFNGVNPAGVRDASATVAVMDGTGVRMMRLVDESDVNRFGVPKPLLLNASLASQAVGPPLSILEMSCGADPARNFPDLGRKLLRLRPLASQEVADDDSVLGPLRYVTGEGLRTTYARLIMQSFDRKFWGARARIDGYTQMEYNFALFWGLAIQLYEATLVSDDTAYDRWAAGDDSALTEQEKLGLAVFSGFDPDGDPATPAAITDARCINCHVGPEFTNATVRKRACEEAGGNRQSIERMIMGNNAVALYDGGFYNIGVRQTSEDYGVGHDNLSYSRQIVTNDVVDYFCVNEAALEVPGALVLGNGERIAADGAHKTPTVRNVELTAPYFHSGGHATLEQVVEFYDSGAGKDGQPELGFHEENIDNLDPDIVHLGLSAEEEQALVAFMKALTDDRVRYEMAPFDHPQLLIPNGHPVDQNTIVENGTTGEAVDEFVEVPAVGAGGRAAPANFLEVAPQTF